MAKRTVVQGSTDVTIDVFIQDSTVTTGAGKTGLAYNTASLVCYFREGATATATALTLATQTVGGAHSDGGFVEIDATNMPGMYRLDLSDTIVSGTNPCVTIMLKGATGMAPCVIELELTKFNPFDAVRGGLTALPNANAEAAGGLYTRGTGAGQINQDANGRIDANVGAISADATAADNAEAFFDGSGYAGTNNVIPTVTTTTTATNVTTVNGLAANAITAASINAGAITAAKFAAGAIDAAALAADAAAEIADAVWDEPTAGHVTAGTTGVALTDVLTDTAEIGTAGAGLTNINLPDQMMNITGNLSGSVGSVTGAVGSVSAAVTVGTNNDKTDYTLSAAGIASVLTTQMTQSYAADGAAPTLAQALFLIQQMLGDFAISGSTLTVKKLDGTTTAATFTLDDGTSPTSITRAT